MGTPAALPSSGSVHDCALMAGQVFCPLFLLLQKLRREGINDSFPLRILGNLKPTSFFFR